MKFVSGSVTATPEQYIDFMNGFCSGDISDSGLFSVAEIREAHVLHSLIRVITFDTAIRLVGADFESNPSREIVAVAPHPDANIVGRMRQYQEPHFECDNKCVGFCCLGDFLDGWRDGHGVQTDEIPVSDVGLIEVYGQQVWDIALKFPLCLFKSGVLIRSIDRIKIVIENHAYDYGVEHNHYVERYLRPYVPFGFDDLCVFKPIGGKLLPDELWYGPAGFTDLLMSRFQGDSCHRLNRQYDCNTYGHPAANVLKDFLAGQYYPSQS